MMCRISAAPSMSSQVRTALPFRRLQLKIRQKPGGGTALECTGKYWCHEARGAPHADAKTHPANARNGRRTRKAFSITNQLARVVHAVTL